MGSVKLVGVTKPVGFAVTGEIHTAEDLIAYCARVSNPNNQHNTLTAERLLKYLAKHKHWSPFEMVHVVMEINTTRDIARQILRHRSFSFQEFSQRYAEVDDKSFTIKEARMQDAANRQNSIETNSALTQETWEQYQNHSKNAAIAAYKWAINSGIAKEVARSVLPEGLTNSRLYMSGSLRSWIHYCDLRMGNGTQKEHRLIATECWDVIVKEFPSLKNVLENNQ
jgi:thymidylate synthase (FAD)